MTPKYSKEHEDTPTIHTHTCAHKSRYVSVVHTFKCRGGSFSNFSCLVGTPVRKYWCGWRVGVGRGIVDRWPLDKK